MNKHFHTTPGKIHAHTWTIYIPRTCPLGLQWPHPTELFSSLISFTLITNNPYTEDMPPWSTVATPYCTLFLSDILHNDYQQSIHWGHACFFLFNKLHTTGKVFLPMDHSQGTLMRWDQKASLKDGARRQYLHVHTLSPCVHTPASVSTPQLTTTKLLKNGPWY